MSKETIASKVEKHFAGNPTRKEVFATSDGFLFERKENALRHLKTLENKNVETFTKSGKVEDIDVEADDVSEVEKKTAKVEAEKNTAGAKKHPANTGSDQKTAK
tara:strand:+ start:4301 stop:4612 length:312 start_codon:yes stop_codon:yes gene_type:complete